jgi:benzoyl-CoA-dihydrodiol lyase
MIDFQTEPSKWRHWRLTLDGPVATLAMDVAEDGGLDDSYELKLNTYDLAVDIELHDAVQRLRFEHPEVRTVVITSGKDRIFSAGANIRMLAGADHAHKVNFCKFTNETRNAIEDASANSGQTYICAINGLAAGGGYELALACDEIIMLDDGATSVALPEVPLLAVLPGTGGLTRLVDKRKVRRDRADFFCTIEEGIRGSRAVEWHLVDEVVPRSRMDEVVAHRAAEAAARSDRPAGARGIELAPLEREITEARLTYATLTVGIDRAARVGEFRIQGPTEEPPADAAAVHAAGTAFWPLALARELDDAILHLRLNEPEIGTWVFRTEGDGARVVAYDELLEANADEWLVREITLFLKRVLKRLEVSARSIFALIEPGSCFAGTLLELALAADRSYMLAGGFEGDNRPAATIALSGLNFGAYPSINGLTRLAGRFLDDADGLAEVAAARGTEIEAEAAEQLGLVTFAPDDIDWQDEVRIAIEERAAFSPDALTGMEASLRFAGPETMESKIFARLSAWQNWIFQRPNAVGENGALSVFGSGRRADFDMRRT